MRALSSPEVRAFLLQYRTSEYRVFDALQSLSRSNDLLTVGVGNQSRPNLVPGSRVYLWEAGGRDLVGRGVAITRVEQRDMPQDLRSFLANPHQYDPTEPRVVIRIDCVFTTPISRKHLQQDVVVAKAPFFRNKANSQGSYFFVDPDVSHSLDRIICETRLPIDG